MALGPILLTLAVAACDTTPKRDATGQPTTTGATTDASARETIGEDLNQVGEKLGEAAKKAAIGAKEEAKDEWKKLDVRVETNGPSARDAGAPSRVVQPAPAKHP